MKKIIFIVIESIIILFLLLLIFTQLLGVTWSNKILFTSKQPKNIDYHSYDPYSLYIIRQTETFGHKYIIMVSKDAEPSYGHVINHIDPYILRDAECKVTKVKWMKTGIEVEMYLNHKLFIPDKAFTGGR
ncbi:MAG: hypothetical protein KKH98_07375 [Spirochaetes bacterium]|nr:hypothetical protein [Spirochaetota bacterium]